MAKSGPIGRMLRTTHNAGPGRPVCCTRGKEEGLIRARRVAAVVGASAMMLSVAAFPALAGNGGGATQEEFVCFRSAGEKIKLGTGKVITTPSGNVNVVCTGKPID